MIFKISEGYKKSGLVPYNSKKIIQKCKGLSTIGEEHERVQIIEALNGKELHEKLRSEFQRSGKLSDEWMDNCHILGNYPIPRMTRYKKKTAATSKVCV